MNINHEIQKTQTYCESVRKTPFLKKILLKKQTTDSIERILYQAQKFGEGYIKDKNYSAREVRIAKEIFENLKNN